MSCEHEWVFEPDILDVCCCLCGKLKESSSLNLLFSTDQSNITPRMEPIEETPIEKLKRLREEHEKNLPRYCHHS
jgi:hypothetical protein